jgi:hypothetical protein
MRWTALARESQKCVAILLIPKKLRSFRASRQFDVLSRSARRGGKALPAMAYHV